MSGTDILVTKVNESYLKIDCDKDISMELSENFSFQMPGYQFAPLYNMGKWDGYIRLFSLSKKQLPLGLLDELKKFCSDRGYGIDAASGKYGTPGETADITLNDVSDFVATLGLDTRAKPIEVRDYQLQGIYLALYNYRAILNSSVGSGKSLMISGICRYVIEKYNYKTLIIVPTISLTKQMKSDFADYFGHTGWSADDNIHTITAGVDKNVDKNIVVSTYQSLAKLDSKWFNQFGLILVDEAHKITAATIANIFNKATEVKYKLGVTGTTHDTKCNILQMIGLTGKIFDIASSAKLIEAGHLSPLKIKALILKYPVDVCKNLKSMDYDAEIHYICSNEKRISFISKLALSCKGTTLILFRFVEIQGIPIYNKLLELAGTSRKIHYIAGSVSGEDREEIRMAANESADIIVASGQTFATGVNLPAVENIIFASPTKSAITVIQSIGRGLRLKDSKTHCTLYDITDDMSYKKYINTTLTHFGERLNIYTKNGFTFGIITLPFSP